MSADSGPVFRYSSRFDEALCFAAEKHRDQRRKGTSIPYIVHPVHVARLLTSYGLDEETVLAGMLHDVLEDTDCTEQDLAASFGAAVAETVRQCTEPDKERSWEERKQGQIERMSCMPAAARAVSCADKAHNLHTMADAVARGEALWSRFKRGPREQVDFHRRALQALSTGFDHPILDELSAALRRLEALLARG